MEENSLKKNTKETTYPVPFIAGEIKAKISAHSNAENKPSKEQLMIKALRIHSLGKISKAAKYYQYCIEQGLNDPRVFSNYGVILKDLGKYPEAELSTRKAIELNPDYINAHLNLGNILRDLGKFKEAELSTRKAIELNPDYAEAHLNLGNILRDLGKFKEAELSTRKAIELNPDYAKAHLNLGNILRDLGKFKEAELSTRKAIELNPDYAKAHYNLGLLLIDMGQLLEAKLSTSKAIELNPDYAEAHLNLGSILKDLDKLEEAELSTRKAIEVRPDYVEAHTNLGTLLKNLGKLKEAKTSFQKAIELKPDFAEASWNLALLELLTGDYKNGLENYEFRSKTKSPIKPHGKAKIKPVDSQKINKEENLLVVSEQGLGDTLQYMRYIPYLRSQGLSVLFSAQKKLHSLIRSSNIDNQPLTPEEAYNVSEGQWIPLLSLPRYLKVSPEKPIISEPYIFTTNELKKKWKDILSRDKKLIIGINWQGNPEIEHTYQGRSLPLEKFSTLNINNEITMLSLQKGFGSEQLEYCSFKNKFVECQSQIDSTWDFLENAAIIENCDLIITCDTSIAHLAGGMGKKVWLLLKDIPYWTWGLEGESTFWYPTMRLFRQKKRYDWNEVMERVASVLKKEMEPNV